ncbi:diaminopimelate epimerase, partial [Mycolicibacterium elephantis]
EWDGTTADVTVDMGKANHFGTGEAIVGGRPFAGLAIDVGNPHLACVDPDLTLEELIALDVAAPVSFDSAQFPEGVNVEVLTAPVDGSVSMRVHERGVGETRSCGTGTVAAAVAALAFSGATTGTLRVRIPGGEVTVTVTDTSSYLR